METIYGEYGSSHRSEKLPVRRTGKVRADHRIPALCRTIGVFRAGAGRWQAHAADADGIRPLRTPVRVQQHEPAGFCEGGQCAERGDIPR